MTFLNPLFLFGLAAAALPLLIHLLNLRKLKVIEFSSLRFLKELQKTRIRRMKVRQILLLIIRTLLVIFIVLSFSRPALQGNVAGFTGSAAQSTMIILLDDSPSMMLRTQQGTIFNQARESIGRILNLAEPGDRIYFLTLSDAVAGSPLPPARSAQEITGILSSLEPSDRTIPFTEAMHTVRAILSETEEINRELFLVSDMRKSQFAQGSSDSTRLSGNRASLFGIAIDGADRIDNRGITGLTMNAQVITLSRPIAFSTLLVNGSETPIENLLLSVYLDGIRSAQRSAAIPASAASSHQFDVTPRRSGVLTGVVEIEDDQMESDNRRYFTITVPPAIRVALVGTADAARFLDLALSATEGAGFGDLFSVETIDESRIGSIDMAAYDVLILSGVKDLTLEEGDRIVRFIVGGGGMAFFPGPTTDLISLNRSLFGKLGIPAIDETPGGGSGSLSFGKIDMVHPLFSGLFEEAIGGRGETDVESPRIVKSVRLSAGRSGNALIGLSDGSPFLVDYGIGAGRVLMFAADAALQWSDLAIKGLFAPLVHRSAVYLETGREDRPEIIAGKPASISVRTPAVAGATYIINTPEGLTERVTPVVNPLTGMTMFQIPATRSAGIYELYREDGGSEPIGAVAVNIDPAESALELMEETDMRAFFEAGGFEGDRISLLPPDEELGRVVQESRYGVELWKTMIGIALLLAVVEMAVARAGRSEPPAAGGIA